MKIPKSPNGLYQKKKGIADSSSCKGLGQKKNMRLARTLRAPGQMAPDIGALAGAGYHHGVA